MILESSSGSGSDEFWKTPSIRRSIASKIEEAKLHSGLTTSKNAVEMEGQAFAKAKSKDEYLRFVAILILHIKEMGAKTMKTSSKVNMIPASLRQSMVTKIEEAILHSGLPTSKNAVEMEGQLFAKAKSKDEYLSFVARLIIHIKQRGERSMRIKIAIESGMGGNPENPGQSDGKALN